MADTIQSSSHQASLSTMSRLSHFRQLRNIFSTALKDFSSSDAKFRVLRSLSSSDSIGRDEGSNTTPSTISHTERLYVLDSSFNPPSKAHLEIAASAILDESHQRIQQNDRSPHVNTSSRILFLLATQNADKAPKPAPFEDRLVMMTLMAEQLRDQVAHDLRKLRRQNSNTTITPTVDEDEGSGHEVPEVDIGVTKFPFFMDKARSIDESGVYTSSSSQTPSDSSRESQSVFQQVHLTGYDTFIRIFDAKYYKPDDLSVLEPFLSRHRLRVLHRLTDSESNPNVETEVNDLGKEGQKEYLEKIRRGERENEGAKKEWADRVEFVDLGDKIRGVSSTQARKCVKDVRMGREELGKFVGEDVRLYMLEMGLYTEDVGGKL